MLDTNTRINDHIIAWLPRGQTVAAQVPYTKRKQEWIVASVVSWNEDELTYVVKDEFPENKKMKSWTIPHHKVIRFPRDLRDPLMPGDRVLSLWYIPDTEEWSSMFYEATIVNTDEMDKTSTIWLRFNGDDEVYEIDSMKIVKKPKRRAKVPKRPFTSAINGSNSSPLHSPPTDVYDDGLRSHHPRFNVSPPDPLQQSQPPHKKQRVMKTEMEDQHHPPSRNGTETSPFSPPSTSSSSSSSTSSMSVAAAAAAATSSSSPYAKSSGANSSNGNRVVSPEREHQPPQHHHAPVSAAVFNNRYQFCGVLGKKMKRMGAILNERSKVSNT
jgi:hypothetical protein